MRNTISFNLGSSTFAFLRVSIRIRDHLVGSSQYTTTSGVCALPKRELEDDGRKEELVIRLAECRCARGIRLLKPNLEQPIKFVWPRLRCLRERACIKRLRL